MSTPVEITEIVGSDANETLYVTKSVVDAIPPGYGWSRSADALAGDDAIVRDRTGAYYAEAGEEANADVFLYGGYGTDIVSYAGLSTGININLDADIAVQKMPANAPDHIKAFGVDRLYGIEGAVGTIFADGMIGGDNRDRLWGHDGSDTIETRGGNDTVYGGTGNDTIDGGSGDDAVHGENGHDLLRGGGGNDTVAGGDGNDDLFGALGSDSLSGGEGNDEINGGFGADSIEAGDGNDVAHGGHNNDTIRLGDGSDLAFGDFGNDTIVLTGFGDHTVHGGIGSDTVEFGNSAANVHLHLGWAIRGTDGTDTVTGFENVRSGAGNDFLQGTDGANVMLSGAGNDHINGFGGNDSITAGNGIDSVSGGHDNDVIAGEANDDWLGGDGGNDAIYGGSGADVLRGGSGADWMTGGTGPDTFFWNEGDLGLDRIVGFNINEDKFQFGQDFLADGALSEVLMATHVYGLGTVLVADTVEADWEMIAVLPGVSVSALNTRIANGTILDVELTDIPTGPGDLEVTSPNTGSASGWDFIA